MRADLRRIVLAVVLLLGVAPLVGARPAAADGLPDCVTTGCPATGGGELGFNAGGVLPLFPCQSCRASFYSFIGGGPVTLESPTGLAAVFDAVNTYGTGSVDYSEPGGPLCPAIGSAIGHVDYNGYGIGRLVRTEDMSELGLVDSYQLSIDFTYERLGTTMAMVITGGILSVKSHYWYGDYFVTLVTHVGGQAVARFTDADMMAALNDCSSPQSLPFLLEGNVVLHFG